MKGTLSLLAAIAWIAIAIIMAGLAGCSNTDYVQAKHIADAQERCKANGGLKAISSSASYYNVYCNNGAMFEYLMKNP